MTSLTLIRHAEPDWFGEDGLTTNNPGLSARGLRQAELLRDWVGSQPPFTHRWTSRLRRAVETAEVVGGFERLGWLDELMQPPSWEGLGSLGPVREALDGFMLRSRHDKWGGFEGGEDMHCFFERVMGGLDRELEGVGVNSADFHYRRRDFSEGARVLVVAHAGVLGIIVSYLLHNGAFPEDMWHRYPFAFGGVSRLSLTPSGRDLNGVGLFKWQLDFHNFTGHLGHFPWEFRTVHGVVGVDGA